MTAFRKLNDFSIDNSEVTLWTFKKQSPRAAPPKFNGHWVHTTPEMDAELRSIILQQRNSITEQSAYSLLAQPNESSALNISQDETHVGLILDQIGAELNNRRIRDVKTLRNCLFYVIKLVHDGNVIFAIRKTDQSWRSITAKNMVTALFSDAQLDVTADEDFRIQRNVDFFCLDDEILVRNKANFESVLNYKAAHERDYATMCSEADFVATFDDLSVLTDFIGSNKIQLRRMSAIRQKGFYADPIFMENLKNRCGEFGLTINFDDQGKIIPTPDTCRDIIAALLDHRLRSGFSGNVYDVPDTVRV